MNFLKFKEPKPDSLQVSGSDTINKQKKSNHNSNIF